MNYMWIINLWNINTKSCFEFLDTKMLHQASIVEIFKIKKILVWLLKTASWKSKTILIELGTSVALIRNDQIHNSIVKWFFTTALHKLENGWVWFWRGLWLKDEIMWVHRFREPKWFSFQDGISRLKGSGS